MVRRQCCIKGCQSKFAKGNGLSFHRYQPSWNIEAACKSPLTKNPVVCSRHFFEGDYLGAMSSRKLLKNGAVPILNLPEEQMDIYLPPEMLPESQPVSSSSSGRFMTDIELQKTASLVRSLNGKVRAKTKTIRELRDKVEEQNRIIARLRKELGRKSERRQKPSEDVIEIKVEQE